jgi:hypothetical protein
VSRKQIILLVESFLAPALCREKDGLAARHKIRIHHQVLVLTALMFQGR